MCGCTATAARGEEKKRKPYSNDIWFYNRDHVKREIFELPPSPSRSMDFNIVSHCG